jgi:hypothetical protein
MSTKQTNREASNPGQQRTGPLPRHTRAELRHQRDCRGESSAEHGQCGAGQRRPMTGSVQHVAKHVRRDLSTVASQPG